MSCLACLSSGMATYVLIDLQLCQSLSILGGWKCPVRCQKLVSDVFIRLRCKIHGGIFFPFAFPRNTLAFPHNNVFSQFTRHLES